jgi:hypothetical protein
MLRAASCVLSAGAVTCGLTVPLAQHFPTSALPGISKLWHGDYQRMLEYNGIGQS